MESQAVSERARRSNSSSAQASLLDKLRYNFALLRMRAQSGGGAEAAREVHQEMAELVALFEAQTGLRAADSTVLEIGFGARPYRAFALTAFFGRVHAMDLDAPVLRLADLPRVLRRNGVERACKSLARHVLFDAREWVAFHREMRRLAPAYRPEAADFIVGDAASSAAWRDVGQPQFVVSYDVFEHIPAAGLAQVVARMRERLDPRGVAFVRPMVFTGIHGGHDLEWYPGQSRTHDPARAWRHLLDPDFRVDTYLNRLTRREFRAAFENAGFEVLRDHPRLGDASRRFLTDELRDRLAPLDDYELFSNEVEFLLR